ncbi:MAG: hypothetical protein OZ948_11565 [Deltaproteobacteria bacterium]|nr:hypothetical protein [Deltaproteobacteria bacterium]
MGGREAGRTRRRAGALVLLAALATGLGVWSWRSRTHARLSAPLAVSAAPPPPASGAGATAPGRARRRPAPAPEPLPEPIRRFLEATPYPASSGRLTRAHEDLLFPNRRHERPRPIPDTAGAPPGEQVTWLFTADHWAYVGPDTVHAWLEVRQGEAAVPVEVVAASAVREGRSGPVGEPYPLVFRPEGDRLVTELPLHRFADHHGAILLTVRFAWAPGREHEDALRIFSTPADRIPGRFASVHDSLYEGSLRIGVGIDLDQAGFYRFDANVYGADGEPLAFASFKGELAPGAQTVPLDVYGKILRDAGVPGPYTIGEVRGYRFLDGRFPDREELLLLPGRHKTRRYPLDVFTNASHVDAHELHMVELMREDLARGVAVVVPPRPGGTEAPPAAARSGAAAPAQP